MRNEESKLQQAVVTWFRLQYREYSWLLFAIPNGNKRNAITAAILKREGVLAGVADLFLSVPNKQYHGLYIELKYGKNKQQDSQKEFQKHCEHYGYKYIVIYDFMAFKNEITKYLEPCQILQCV